MHFFLVEEGECLRVQGISSSAFLNLQVLYDLSVFKEHCLCTSTADSQLDFSLEGVECSSDFLPYVPPLPLNKK